MSKNILKVMLLSIVCMGASTSCMDTNTQYDNPLKDHQINKQENFFSEMIPAEKEAEFEPIKAEVKPWKLRKKDKKALKLGILDAGLLSETYLISKALGGDYSLTKDDFGALAILASAGFLVGVHSQMVKNSAEDKYNALLMEDWRLQNKAFNKENYNRDITTQQTNFFLANKYTEIFAPGFYRKSSAYQAWRKSFTTKE
jgi:hypothetical protein